MQFLQACGFNPLWISSCIFNSPVRVWGFPHFLAGMLLLSTMDKFMCFQVVSLSIEFTTFFANMLLLSTIDKFMYFQVASLSIRPTTFVAVISILSAIRAI